MALQPSAVVNVITEVPAATPVTVPVALTVATCVSDETHGLVTAGVPVADSVVAEPLQRSGVPVMTGLRLTVTVAVVLQPELSV